MVPPIFKQDFSCPALLNTDNSFLRVPACHRLRGSFPAPSAQYFICNRLVRVRSPLLTESRLISFPAVLRCFSSLRSLPLTMNSLKDTAIIRWVAPFGYPRIKDRSHLPAAFRKVLRPSSPLSAKAFTKCSCLLVLSLRIYKIHTQLLTIKRPPPFVRRTHLWIFAHKY